MKRYRCHIPQLLVVLLSLISVFASCSKGSKITFSKDISPIIQKNCFSCHHKGGAAPFTLETYHDVVSRAKMISFVTASRYMPPWPADRHFSSFINEKTLTDEEIELIGLWYKNGCKPGDTNSIKQTVLASESISVLGKPDMILSLPAVEIQNNNRDKFLVMKIPVELPRERYVRAVEFIPGQSAYAHHVNGHYLRFDDITDPNKGSRLADIEAPDFVEQFSRLSLTNSDGTMPERIHSAVNYLPGAFGLRYPEGIGGFKMGKKGAFVANDIHYGPSTKTLIDSSKLYLYFSNTPPKRPSFEFMMGTNGVSKIEPPLSVAPNMVSRHVSRLTIFNDISVLTVNPHMHLIGTKFKAYAVKPNGDTVNLIHIPKWQFRWQYFYTFKNPVRIPRGSEIIVEAEFDNTLKNPNNPFNPPITIGERMDRGGASMRTTDEMLQFIVTYLPYQKGDENIDLSKP